jgi:hypothetical protein
MRRLILCSLLAAAALPVSVASAGGWATAGVGPPPDGMSGGDTWNAQITILQHGNAATPLVGVKPTLTIRNESGKTATFAAKPTGKDGVYLAKVTFPSDGKWRYEVYDGFTQYGGAKTHTFGAISVDGGGGSDSSFPLVPSIGGAALVLLAAAGLVLLIRRQRRAEPAPA